MEPEVAVPCAHPPLFAVARHLVPTCPPPPRHPSSPKGAGCMHHCFCFQHSSSHGAAYCWKNALSVWKEERTWGAHYNSELLSDKWAMKRILTSLRCSWTCCLFQPPPECICGKSGVLEGWPKPGLGVTELDHSNSIDFFQVLSIGDVDIL